MDSGIMGGTEEIGTGDGTRDATIDGTGKEKDGPLGTAFLKS